MQLPWLLVKVCVIARGVIDDILMPLAEKHIAVPMINQGASRIAIMIGTYNEDADDAVRAIYHRFFAN